MAKNPIARNASDFGLNVQKKLAELLGIHLILNDYIINDGKDSVYGKDYATMTLLDPSTGEVFRVSASNVRIVFWLREKVGDHKHCPIKLTFYKDGKAYDIRDWSDGDTTSYDETGIADDDEIESDDDSDPTTEDK